MLTPDQVVWSSGGDTDGLSFSLCAVLLDIIGSCISEYMELEPQKGGIGQMGEWRSSLFQTRVGPGQRG